MLSVVKWFPVLCSHMARGCPSCGMSHSAVYWLIVVRCEYYPLLGCSSQWMVLFFFGFSNEVPTVFISGVCFGSFKFRLHLSFFWAQWFLFLRDENISLHRNHYEVILHDNHWFSDCDCICQSDSFRNFSRNGIGFLKIYTQAKTDSFYSTTDLFHFLLLHTFMSLERGWGGSQEKQK